MATLSYYSDQGQIKAVFISLKAMRGSSESPFDVDGEDCSSGLPFRLAAE